MAGTLDSHVEKVKAESVGGLCEILQRSLHRQKVRTPTPQSTSLAYKPRILSTATEERPSRRRESAFRITTTRSKMTSRVDYDMAIATWYGDHITINWEAFISYIEVIVMRDSAKAP
jgi:hypothetical protein